MCTSTPLPAMSAAASQTKSVPVRSVTQYLRTVPRPFHGPPPRPNNPPPAPNPYSGTLYYPHDCVRFRDTDGRGVTASKEEGKKAMHERTQPRFSRIGERTATQNADRLQSAVNIFNATGLQDCGHEYWMCERLASI
jgi:hypothetical protein